MKSRLFFQGKSPEFTKMGEIHELFVLPLSLVWFGLPGQLVIFQDDPGTEPEPETGTVGTVFPGTERGTGTVGTVFQEPKPELEPSLAAKTVLSESVKCRFSKCRFSFLNLKSAKARSLPHLLDLVQA